MKKILIITAMMLAAMASNAVTWTNAEGFILESNDPPSIATNYAAPYWNNMERDIYITNETPKPQWPRFKSEFETVKIRMEIAELRLKHLERSTTWLWTMTGGIVLVMAMAGIARCRK